MISGLLVLDLSIPGDCAWGIGPVLGSHSDSCSNFEFWVLGSDLVFGSSPIG